MKFTKHARKRMRQRGITEAQVRDTIRKPDRVHESDKQRDVYLYQRQIRPQRILVVLFQVVRKLVITVYKRKTWK